MAVSMAGSDEKVRQAMRASTENFALYREGRKEPTTAEFTRLVDFIVERQAEQIAAHRALSAQIRAKLASRKT